MIYVDELITYGGGYSGLLSGQAARVGARNGHRWCHLFSDEKDPEFPQLHAFAAKLGMRRTWSQGDHYDLTPGRRGAAVRAGAKEATRSEAVAIWRSTPRARSRRRDGGIMKNCFYCDGTGEKCDVCGESEAACKCDLSENPTRSECEVCGGTGEAALPARPQGGTTP